MQSTRLAWRRKAVLIAIVLSALAPAWSDGRLTGNSAETKKTCYCDCDKRAGTPMCTHMCELPKYANRWWASSCHKKQLNVSPGNSPDPKTRSKKNNRAQDARL
jgi:hypothetical protein